MDFADQKFRPRWPTALLFLPLIGLFIGLGIWQLERAAEKRALADEVRARADLPALRLDAPVTDVETLRFRRLEATGTYDHDDQIFLENRRHGQRAGFHVITPLRLTGLDLRVLVNRGWIPADDRGQPVAAPVPLGTVLVEGEAHIPAPPALVLHGGPEAAAAWGDRWPYLTLELFASTVAYPLQPAVILLDPAAEGGFLRKWPRELPKEGMHIGYAVQWFAFAIIALAVLLRLSLRQPGGRGPAS
jgi:surfeit locus 1 family protein